MFEMLLGDPAWLMEHAGMPETEALAFADFHAFWELSAMRWLAAKLLYELHLYTTADDAIAREQYAGLLGLNLGVRVAPEEYLATTDDGLYVARYARATMVAGRPRRLVASALRRRVVAVAGRRRGAPPQLVARPAVECGGRGCASRV